MDTEEKPREEMVPAGDIPLKHDWKGLFLVSIISVVAIGLCCLAYPFLKDMIQRIHMIDTEVGGYKAYLKEIDVSSDRLTLYVNNGTFYELDFPDVDFHYEFFMMF